MGCSPSHVGKQKRGNAPQVLRVPFSLIGCGLQGAWVLLDPVFHKGGPQVTFFSVCLRAMLVVPCALVLAEVYLAILTLMVYVLTRIACQRLAERDSLRLIGVINAAKPKAYPCTLNHGLVPEHSSWMCEPRALVGMGLVHVFPH